MERPADATDTVADNESHAANMRVAYLTNILAPYWKPTFEELASVYTLRIFLSIPMESNRSWAVDWGSLDVVVQRTITVRRTWKHPKGFAEPIFVHLPLDSISQLRRFRPHLVISNEMGLRTLVACFYRKLAPQSRLLIFADVAGSTERGRGHLRSWLRRSIRRHADGFLVSGNSGKRYLQRLGVQERRIFRVGYATDLRRFLEVPISRAGSSAYRLLYVGQLIARKGLAQFVAALSAWCIDHEERRVEFVVVGDGPLRTDLEQARVPCNLSITFRGNMAFSDLAHGAYEECGLFAFPTFADTWGLVVNEALASGLPVMGSVDSQAVEELIEDGRNGWCFRPDRIEDIYAAIDRAMNTPVASLNDMRQRAREKALLHSPQAVAARIQSAVQQVMNGIE